MWLVASAAQGFKGKLGAILEWKPVLFVGKISYGMYLYHFFMLYLARGVAVSLELKHPGKLTFPFATALTFLAATASWYLVEKPISRWKNNLNYGRHGELTANVQDAA